MLILQSFITHIHNKHFRLQKVEWCLSFRTNNCELKWIIHFCLLLVSLLMCRLYCIHGRRINTNREYYFNYRKWKCRGTITVKGTLQCWRANRTENTVSLRDHHINKNGNRFFTSVIYINYKVAR